jgi:hypothetical protein
MDLENDFPGGHADETQLLDQIDLRRSPRVHQFQAMRALMSAARQEAVDQTRFDLPMRPTYRFVNDNRYEQHWWSWSS